MHDIEPHYNWRHHYIAEEDERSPFFGREYSEFEFTNSIYGYCIHPQWDDIDSPTLFIKLLCVDYDEQFAIIEMLGEWNDCINNDIMFFKRDVIDKLIENGISKFILIGENILNFHYSDESYYEEWKEDISSSGGWIALLGFREHVLSEFEKINLFEYFNYAEEFNAISWRPFTPLQLFQVVEKCVQKQLN
jgi:hypothetical protein